jgi:hypothetical protein
LNYLQAELSASVYPGGHGYVRTGSLVSGVSIPRVSSPEALVVPSGGGLISLYCYLSARSSSGKMCTTDSSICAGLSGIIFCKIDRKWSKETADEFAMSSVLLMKSSHSLSNISKKGIAAVNVRVITARAVEQARVARRVCRGVKMVGLRTRQCSRVMPQ